MTNATDHGTTDHDATDDPHGSPEEPVFETEALFDPDHYLQWLGEVYEEERTVSEVDFLESTGLALEGDDRVLDVPCGHGRHANRLASRGYRVAGLDQSEPFLERARREAAERGVADRVDYRQGDMRELPWGEDRFDAAYNVFTSFGFFDEAGNRTVLEEFARVLRPGGRLVLEMADRDAMLSEYRPESVTDLEDGHLVERREFDPRTGRNHTERTVVLDGEVYEATFEVRLYSFTELRSLLERVGFRVREVYGNMDGEEYSLETNRMCVVAERSGE